MEDTEFEWDDEKAESNLKKHGVSFDEAATIFNDPNIATILDPDHSEHEERFVSIGSSVIARLLTVIHTFRKTRIRLISARKATKVEKKRYENY
ncbi:MAG: BrnT family toxin [Anaerolineales bacterium]|nr:MAG: BrnT family toxin [Chloroflexota bacterium]MCE7859409.1 BrnT family toxin [Chloroflexi bacterium CFX2]MCK6583714.1 BrnT family toxin [Anaerolineales bacterium]